MMRTRTLLTQAQFSVMRQLVMVCVLLGALSVLVVKSGQRDFGDVQAQVEVSAIKTNLGGLRTALVIDYVARQAAVSTVRAVAAPAQADSGANPFQLLHRVPANYVGEVRAAEASRLPPGSWLFDPECRCIGYRPLYPEWLSSPSGAGVLWFDVVGDSGPLQLRPRELYRWKGEVLA